jgi:hypothetical protein
MKLLLDTEYDIISYINYLHETDQLTTLFKEITVPDNKIADFLFYLSEASIDDEQNTIDTSEDRAGKRWSQDEKLLLQELINTKTPIQEIAVALRRTVESIRKQARTSLDAVFLDGEWLDIPF